MLIDYQVYEHKLLFFTVNGKFKKLIFTENLFSFMIVNVYKVSLGVLVCV